VAVPLAGLTAVVMVVSFITARVAEAGDWPAFMLLPSWCLDWCWGWHGSVPEWPAANLEAPGQAFDLRDHNLNRPPALSLLGELGAGDLRFLQTVGDRL